MSKEFEEYILNKGKLDFQFGKYSKIYSMTTENISGFIDKCNVKDKDVLTVMGSGDQRLNAYFNGAKNVTCFDINPITLYNAKLKDAVIKNVNYEKFIKFFGIKSNRYGNYYQTLDSRIFAEVSNYLDEETLSFFKFIINEDNQISYDSIYFNFDNEINRLKKMNNYLNSDSYYNMREIIKDKKIDFINSNISELKEKLKGQKYDIILLSNISDYTHLMFPENDLENYRNLVDELSEVLNPGGIMQVGYIYIYYGKNTYVSDFRYSEERKRYFPDELFKTVFVDSYYSSGNYDKVITYTKKK